MLFLCLQTRNNCISSSGLKNFKILIKASSSKSTKLAIASYQLDKNMLQLRYLMLCDALSDLVPQFKYHKKHPWRSVTFSKTSKFTKSNTPPCVFFTFFELQKWYQIAQSVWYWLWRTWISYYVLKKIEK